MISINYLSVLTLAAGGDAAAQETLGQLHLQSKEPSQEIAVATGIMWLRTAIANGGGPTVHSKLAPALVVLAQYHVAGGRTSEAARDMAEAIAIFDLKIENGDPLAPQCLDFCINEAKAMGVAAEALSLAQTWRRRIKAPAVEPASLPDEPTITIH